MSVISDHINLAKFMRTNALNHPHNPASPPTLSSKLGAHSNAAVGCNKEEQPTRVPPASSSGTIVLKSGPTREMCLMLQSGEEVNFDRFLKFYLPPKNIDSLVDKTLEDKVALTYSIVSYYNQLAAGVQQPPPGHLSFLRVDGGRLDVNAPSPRADSTASPSPLPHSLRLPNINTFNNGTGVMPDSNENNAIHINQVNNSQSLVPTQIQKLSNTNNNSTNNSMNVSSISNMASGAVIKSEDALAVSTISSTIAESDLLPRKPGRPSNKIPRAPRLSGKYACSHCGKGFPQNSQLDQHMRVHTGEKPYPCNECDSRFKQLCHLKQHMRAKHTGERPYQCRYCDKKFVQMCHLQQHERSSNHKNHTELNLNGEENVRSRKVTRPRKSTGGGSSENNPITNLNGTSLLSAASFSLASQVVPVRLSEINGNHSTISLQQNHNRTSAQTSLLLPAPPKLVP